MKRTMMVRMRKPPEDSVFRRVAHGDVPGTVQEALRAKTDIIGRAIVEILQGRPNFSCVRDRMPTYILKLWNIRTRGYPRQRFASKVDDIIAVMARKNYITVYKSKNTRIKLGWEQFPGCDILPNNVLLFR
ncbi:MAG: hypothetical protein GXY80_03090 [Syntrophorhabdus aromaticivorans]|uniref:Uncharacterized protein n=1 Tax=Syntrophorhabdus aromaticivorans TaxID=328301 RepID=A0A971RZX5_9BACT|nr:hypothetical protein [Syntrophorhabdus aromaticivorans]